MHAKGLNVRCTGGISGITKPGNRQPVKDFLDYYHWETVDEGNYHCMIKFLNEQVLYEATDLFREELPNHGYYRHIGRNTDMFAMLYGYWGDRSHTVVLAEINPLRVANYDLEQIKSSR
ncbi:hypothetical protein BJV82DRAFT_573392 [Fennellomyces sp. T-0311]|nr:hypothetical protein BJV82DRAFT_573392 [Fennellomyces sp. T-0311]